MLLFMSLPRLSSFSSRFVFGLQPAQLLPRLEILSLHEGDWAAFNLDTSHNGSVAVNFVFTYLSLYLSLFRVVFFSLNPCNIQVCGQWVAS